jgi:K+ transporter
MHVGCIAMASTTRADYGFMEDPDVPQAIARLGELAIPIDLADVTYFPGRETILVTGRPGTAIWRGKGNPIIPPLLRA